MECYLPKRPDLSIIIVNWNTCDLLHNCLSSIYSKSCATEFTTYVVDNGSSDGSADMVRADFPQIILIENSNNVGFSRANNQAIAASATPNVLLLNSDTVINPDVLPETLRLLHSDPSIGALGCTLVGADGVAQESYHFHFPHGPTVGGANHTIGKELIQCAHVWGAYLMVKREVIDQVGMLDDTFFMFFEDLDWCWRMHNAGWKIAFAPNYSITHVCRASCSQVDPVEHKRRLIKGLAILREKHEHGFTYRKWRFWRLLHHGQCAAWYWVLNRIMPSTLTAKKAAEHMSMYQTLNSIPSLPSYVTRQEQ